MNVEHHHDLTLSPGDPVRVHEEYRFLAGPAGWYCVELDGGLGAVPPPQLPEVWTADLRLDVVDLGTGDALPTDRDP